MAVDSANATPINIFVKIEPSSFGFLPIASSALPMRYPSPIPDPNIDARAIPFANSRADSISIEYMINNE